MNVLDENIQSAERKRLQDWGIAVRQIGYDIAIAGTKDDQIITVLHQLRQPTFFTRDLDFYKRYLCHTHYCLVYLLVDESRVAEYVRRVLRHPAFNTAAKRMGTVIRAAPTALMVWRLYADQESGLAWPDA